MQLEVTPSILNQLARDAIKKYHPHLMIGDTATVCPIAKALIKTFYPNHSRKEVKILLKAGHSSAFYQGFVLNYIMNKGRIVPPVIGFKCSEVHPIINVGDDWEIEAVPQKRIIPTGAAPKGKARVLSATVTIRETPDHVWEAMGLSKEDSDIFLPQPQPTEKYSQKKAEALYKSPQWRALRYEVLREQNGCCQLCGRKRKDGVILHVDHIIPLSKDWSKRLDKKNLQVLCEECNLGKSNTDEIDWR